MIFRASILTALALASLPVFVLGSVDIKDPTPNYCATLEKENNAYSITLAKNIAAQKPIAESLEEVSTTYHSIIKKIYSDAITELEKKNADTKKAHCSNVHTIPQTINRIGLWQKSYSEFQKYDCALKLLEKVPQRTGKEVSLYQGIQTLSSSSSLVSEERRISKKLLTASESLYGYYIDYYPIHSQFECMIGEMQTYNNSLWDFIDSVVIIPSKFYNYGGTHQ